MQTVGSMRPVRHTSMLLSNSLLFGRCSTFSPITVFGVQTPQMAFGGNVRSRRLTVQKEVIVYNKERGDTPLKFRKPWDAFSKAPTFKVKSMRKRARQIEHEPTPRHDFMMWKKMSGNEVIINLQHYKYLTNAELIGGLI